jgi:hypothetical protein
MPPLRVAQVVAILFSVQLLLLAAAQVAQGKQMELLLMA